MADRGRRRVLREKAITRRRRDAVDKGGIKDDRRPPGKFAKNDSLGHCSNRGCWLCALERNEKREKARRARRRPLPDPEE